MPLKMHVDEKEKSHLNKEKCMGSEIETFFFSERSKTSKSCITKLSSKFDESFQTTKSLESERQNFWSSFTTDQTSKQYFTIKAAIYFECAQLWHWNCIK